MFDRRFNEITATGINLGWYGAAEALLISANNQLHDPANSGTTVALAPLGPPLGIFRIALEQKDAARKAWLLSCCSEIL